MGSRIALAFVLFAVALLPGCEGDGKPAPDAGVTPDAAAEICAGEIGYLGACTADTECGTCSCRSFGHSMICTKTCVVAADCPAPSGGCSSGFCRP